MTYRTVLVIEHDWRMRKLIRANLEALCMVVREAVSLDHGLDMLAQSHPELIILDLDIPGRDALHSLLDLGSIVGNRVPIVVLSSEPPSRAYRIQGDSSVYLQKPFSVPMLLHQVRGALTEGRGDRSVASDTI